MIRHILCAVVFLMSNILACEVAALAQDTPKAEIFAGFSYGNYELIPGESASTLPSVTISGNPSGRLSVFGWNGSVAANMNRWFGLATDFSGYYSGSSTSVTTTETFTCGPGCTQTITYVQTASSPKIHNFLFGPQFSYPSGRIRPFGHFLVGGNHMNVTRSESSSSSGGGGIGITSGTSTVGSSGFAMAAGGGVDYSIKENLAWRIESDYLTGEGVGQDHVRVSTGLVWKLGK